MPTTPRTYQMNAGKILLPSPWARRAAKRGLLCYLPRPIQHVWMDGEAQQEKSGWRGHCLSLASQLKFIPTTCMPSSRPPPPLRTKRRPPSSTIHAAPSPVEPHVQGASEKRGDGIVIVGVGASAGGLEAYTQLLKHLPLDTGMGFVLVQHLDPEHESALAQILSCATSLPVREITHNLPVQANHVYIIPRDTNLTIEQGVLKLEPRERAQTPHRPIDTFF